MNQGGISDGTPVISALSRSLKYLSDHFSLVLPDLSLVGSFSPAAKNFRFPKILMGLMPGMRVPRRFATASTLPFFDPGRLLRRLLAPAQRGVLLQLGDGLGDLGHVQRLELLDDLLHLRARLADQLRLGGLHRRQPFDLSRLALRHRLRPGLLRVAVEHY